jgi:hypothetical protein
MVRFSSHDGDLIPTSTPSPGRFFAAVELKTMLAYVLVNYDIKMANDAGRPRNIPIGSEMMPDTTAQVLFRKRINQIREIQSGLN